MSSAKVLLVDDRPQNLVAMKASVRRLDAEAFTAQSGEEALELLQQQDFAAVVLDIMMPGIDGFETARRIREDPKTKAVPIIFVTAMGSEGEQLYKAYSLGAVDYLTKPIHPAVLKGKLQVMVRLWRRQRLIETQAMALKEQVRKLDAYAERLSQKDQRVSMLHEAKNALIESEEQFRTLVNNIPGVSYRRRAPPEWRMLYISDGVSELTGHKAEEFTGPEKRSFADLIHKEDKESTEELIHRSIERADAFDLSYRIQHADGSLHWVRDRGKALAGGQGEVRWLDGAMFDETEAKNVEEELRRAKNDAESASRAKSDFLANMSHELRTPLHGILSFAAFGIKKHKSAEREKLLSYFQKIHASGETLLNLLNELLDLAKLEAGKMQLEYKSVEMATLLSAVVDEFSSFSSERNVTVAFEPDDEELRLVVDPVRLKQVVRNLLSNALKFSPKGGRIEVSCRCHDDLAVVSIRDHGPGIPEDELAAVFEKFVQSSKTKTGAGGTGLGLAICSQIVTAHRGRIWAENAPSGGSAFSFEIPVQLQEDMAVRSDAKDTAP